MGALLAHRGPDAAGSWSDPAAGVGLAHRRLAIIDLRPEAHQPMSNEDDTLWVAFNGEIYNSCALQTKVFVSPTFFCIHLVYFLRILRALDKYEKNVDRLSITF